MNVGAWGLGTKFRAITTVITLLAALCGCGGGAESPASMPNAPPVENPSQTPATASPPTSNVPPAAFITMSDGSGPAPLQLSFDGSESSDSDGAVTSFTWDFGDGVKAAGATARHTYIEPGVFSVTLTVIDDEGASASTTSVITALERTAPGYRLSGRVRIQTTSTPDSDTNDPNAPGVSNNDFASAQQIVAPATIGGYVGVAAQGSQSGAHFEAGDRRDLFRFSALGGEHLTLIIADARQDLDLRLYDASFEQIDESVGVDALEALEPIRAPGEYFVEVSTFGVAASNYVLTIGPQQAASMAVSAHTPLRASLPFITGEVLLGPMIDSPATNGQKLMVVEDDWTHPRKGGRLARIDSRFEASQHGPRGTAPLSDEASDKHRTLEAIKRLRASGAYAWVEPNLLHRPFAIPSDALLPQQWHFNAIRLPAAWELTQGDDDVIVAVIDTGILPAHPAFSDPMNPGCSRLLPGYDFVSDVNRALDGDGIDADPTDPGSDGLASASDFHGTHVASVIGACTDEYNGIGTGGNIAGAGWRTRVMPLRVLGRNGGSSADFIEALRYAAGLPNASGTVPEQRADIVNLSFGTPAFSLAELNVLQELRALGITVVAAAGNASSEAPYYPAAYDGVISVAATTISDTAASYSNHGPTIDISAPGGDNATDLNGDGVADGVLSAAGVDVDGDPLAPLTHRFSPIAGTSMAAPQVAAVAALMKAVNAGMTPELFDALLARGALTSDLGRAGRDNQYGHGLIHARRAVAAALEAAGDTAPDFALLSAAPSALSFGSLLESVTVRVENAGNLPLSVEPPEIDVPWLTLTPLEVDANGLGEFEARVDRSRLPADGLFSAQVTFTSEAGTLALPIRVQRSAIDAGADAGTSYVVLTDEHGQKESHRVSAQARDGAYDFEFTGVANGRYRLYATTDADHDGKICDSGESCGAWYTLDTPALLEVADDLDDLTFTTTFRNQL